MVLLRPRKIRFINFMAKVQPFLNLSLFFSFYLLIFVCFPSSFLAGFPVIFDEWLILNILNLRVFEKKNKLLVVVSRIGGTTTKRLIDVSRIGEMKNKLLFVLSRIGEMKNKLWVGLSRIGKKLSPVIVLFLKVPENKNCGVATLLRCLRTN